MKNHASRLLTLAVAALFAGTLATQVHAQAAAQPTSSKPPPQADWDKASADILGTDIPARDAAVEKVKAWIKGGWVSSDVWRKWLPALVKANQHQQVADIALLSMLGRPGSDAITNLADFRFKAIYALNKPDGGDELLAAAKSYYNVCDARYVATNGLSFVSQALARARAGDTEIVRKFRAEQLAANAATPANAPAPADPATVPPPSILSTVKVDAAIYKPGLDEWQKRTKYADLIAYANLLLLADKGVDAEKQFRELVILATTLEDEALATEGIAKALRAQDGNARRGLAYTRELAAHNATQPSPLPHALAKPTTATRPIDAGLP